MADRDERLEGWHDPLIGMNVCEEDQDRNLQIIRGGADRGSYGINFLSIHQSRLMQWGGIYFVIAGDVQQERSQTQR
jgi:hypothetical protein